ncbi:RNA family protein [Cryptosporidium andersoni]|uniref:RNA family protein n=1 Tax=Cryptosporidium andersoni TaxID=117008 RepID=A0A1J4MFA3_9CRYT|nr:RNA family protein [Cryptosporidium andersoni]
MESQLKILATGFENHCSNSSESLKVLDVTFKALIPHWISDYGKETVIKIIMELIDNCEYHKYPLEFSVYLKALSGIFIVENSCCIPFKKLIDFCLIVDSSIQFEALNLVSNLLNLRPYYLLDILDIWTESLMEVYNQSDLEKSKSLTYVLAFVISQYNKDIPQDELIISKIFKGIIDGLSNIYRKVLYSQSNKVFDMEFVCYIQKLLLPLLMQSNQTFQDTFYDIVSSFLESSFETNIEMEGSFALLTLSNMLSFLLMKGFPKNKENFMKCLQSGITNPKTNIRKASRFVLSTLETYECNKNGTDALNSFICLLTTLENYNVHILKSNWEHFLYLIELVDNTRFWWISCIIKIGFNHQNSSVRRFVMFQTMNIITQSNLKVPLWLSKDTFFNIYLDYIIASLGGKVSKSIEELFVEFIIIVLSINKEWIIDYWKFISEKVTLFTPLRIFLQPFTISFDKHISSNFSNISEDHIISIRSFDEELCNNSIETIDLFEKASNKKYHLTFTSGCWKYILDVASIINRFTPLILRLDLYRQWAIVSVYYLKSHSKEINQSDIIDFIGIFPEYAFRDKFILTNLKCLLIYMGFYNINFLSNFQKEETESSLLWPELICKGIGLGRVKKILENKTANNNSSLSNIELISVYYNFEYLIKSENISEWLLIKLSEISSTTKSIEVDINYIWFKIHFLSIIKVDYMGESMKNLWIWCLNYICDTFKETTWQENIRPLITYLFALKCLVHLAINMTVPKDFILRVFEILIMKISSIRCYANLQRQWDNIKESSSTEGLKMNPKLYGTDKFGIIRNMVSTKGYPDAFSCLYSDFQLVRTIYPLPVQYRDLSEYFLELNYQLLNILWSQYSSMIMDSSVLSSNIQITFLNSLINKTYNLTVYQYYLWHLFDTMVLPLIKYISNTQGKVGVIEYAFTIFDSVQLCLKEFTDFGQFFNGAVPILIKIISSLILMDLDSEFTCNTLKILIEYTHLGSKNLGMMRSFIFPLFRLLNELFNRLENPQNKKWYRYCVEVISNLLLYKEYELTDGNNTVVTMIQKIQDTCFCYSNQYSNCEIYERYHGYIRFVTITFLYHFFNSVKESGLICKIDFVCNSLNNLMQELNIIVSNYEGKFRDDMPNSTKLSPLPNSVQYRILLRGWQTLCCLSDILKVSQIHWISSVVSFYMRHLKISYSPEIRQYIELFGCKLIYIYPKLCLEPLLSNLASECNNVQVCHSHLVISSFYIINYTYNKSIIQGNIHEKMHIEKLSKQLFATLLSYSICNSALLRTIALYTLEKVASQIDNNDNICSAREQSKLEQTSNNSFVYNILNETLGSAILSHLNNSKDLKRMLKSVTQVWDHWKPLTQCSLDYTLPPKNCLKFSDLQIAQDEFCQNSNLTEYSAWLVDGDLRPSWSLYYSIRRIVATQMTSSWCITTNPDRLSTSQDNQLPAEYKEYIGNLKDYQLKFDPNDENSPEIPMKRENYKENKRSDLIVIGTLIDKIPNLAGLTRTCEVFKVGKLLLKTRKVLNDSIFRQISVTAEKWLPIDELRESDICKYIHSMRLQGYIIIAVEQTASSILLPDFIFPKKSILILGKEKEGIPCDIISMVDKCLEIPQYGLIRSLNVHVSASICIYAYSNQHNTAK